MQDSVVFFSGESQCMQHSLNAFDEFQGHALKETPLCQVPDSCLFVA